MKKILTISLLLLMPLQAQAADVFDFFNSTIDFFNEMLDFKSSGIYQLITSAFARLVVWLTVAAIKFKILMISFSWDVAQEILISFNLSQIISTAWNNLDSTLLNLLTYFKIPEALNVILSAHLTKFVMRFVGL